MKIKLFTIPNLLTLSNLLCGMIATVAILTDGDLHLAYIKKVQLHQNHTRHI